MATKNYKATEVIHHTEDALDSIDIIIQGSVKVTYTGGEFTLEKGDCIGILDSCYDSHTFTYTASTPVALLTYNYKNSEQLLPFLKANKDFSILISASMTRQVCQLIDHFVFTQLASNNLYQFILDSYEDYRVLCKKYSVPAKKLPEFETLTPIDTDEMLSPWLAAYYGDIRKLSKEELCTLFQKNLGFATGYLLKASEDVHKALELCEEYATYNAQISHILLNEDHLDFFDLYTELHCKTFKDSATDSSLTSIMNKLMLYLEGLPSVELEFYQDRVEAYQTHLKLAELALQKAEDADAEHVSQAQEVAHSLDVILDYAELDKESADTFRSDMEEYKQIVDKTSSDDSLVALQRKLTAGFYKLYAAAFRVSLTGKTIPNIVKMFFCFGYVDETLLGIENSLYLYSCTKALQGNATIGVYTLYEWLVAIYEGKKEPCRNEFDLDFNEYVHELKTSGKIDASEVTAMLQDDMEKVTFELENMFPTVNKMTVGRVSSYCPILTENDVLKDLKDMLICANSIKDSFDNVCKYDFTAFYRETLYVNEECDISKEYVQVEIRPDVILMPAIGTRGVMWQEIEGKRRSTPARMMLPILSLTDLNMLLIRLTGEYRWEMCKRIQGSHWNDVSERSLTSDYFDYIQFYKKNHDLSTEAKEKIKLGLIRCRNNFKEAFVQDYTDFVLYEGKGSPRLNKVSRSILFTYCPFSEAICNQLQSNPLYTEVLNRHRIKKQQKLHRHELLIKKIQNSRHPVPEIIEDQLKFLNG